ncbi:hypothetical protein [Demequina sp.]|uniref:hypothetical protein n=1 Tax=Demequina sp. TaxID=2050685 RepID=UPI003D0B213C
MGDVEVAADAWWKIAPYDRLVVVLSSEPDSFGELAWAAGRWRTRMGRREVWNALDALTQSGLATRSPRGWAAAGPLTEIREASVAAEEDYFSRLYAKAVAVGDIKDGDENFCGDCCYQYDDVESIDDGTIRDAALRDVHLIDSPPPPPAPSVNLAVSTVRAALTNTVLGGFLALLVILTLPLVLVIVGAGWAIVGIGRLAKAIFRRA